MTTEAARILTAMEDEARYVVRTATIDLDAFLFRKGEARAAQWRQWDEGAKFQAVALMLERREGDWTVDGVAFWTAHYNEKYAETDQAIPPLSDILALAKERSETAQRHEDWAGAAQLNRVRVNIKRGAHLNWSLGDLLIQSVNNPGLVYAVNARGCTCPNGAAGKASCWHVALFDLLLDMQEEAAATADMEADRAAAAADRATMGRRLCAARSKLLEAA